ncbi:hypothetical protein B0H63DRAFT_184740 [Podospora didyma]|uniref:Uncharacterized protein n=1 Tax=Podospora didyma TaxID=330526 RepID=A0AAE0NQ46_9PEZI|nr:hypothetical protein B0H63DRAFT_184740 [Podospora didyma]
MDLLRTTPPWAHIVSSGCAFRRSSHKALRQIEVGGNINQNSGRCEPCDPATTPPAQGNRLPVTADYPSLHHEPLTSPELVTMSPLSTKHHALTSWHTVPTDYKQYGWLYSFQHSRALQGVSHIELCVFLAFVASWCLLSLQINGSGIGNSGLMSPW